MCLTRPGFWPLFVLKMRFAKWASQACHYSGAHIELTASRFVMLRNLNGVSENDPSCMRTVEELIRTVKGEGESAKVQLMN